ncbi:MAG: 50S ribosomal protein L11 methyltransferase [Muribaculaceae bacterium]|nr:50S ribosomal protein L11 methyltransferase [Muribaculaceae bacterium]
MNKPTMNDYYKVEIGISPASSDFCDLAADLLAAIGFETFVPYEDRPGEGITAYVPAPLYTPEAVAEALDELKPFAEATFEAEFVEGRDWNAEWEKNYFRPILVEGVVAVHSSFHTDIPTAKYDITIDPKMAFGTGHHATTSLMMRALLAAGVEGKSVIDMGTGSGILAILAAMLGANPVTGIEIDAFAEANARDNVALNLADTDAVKIIGGDASALASVGYEADFFLANINRNVITADIGRYAAATRKGGVLVVSGFYVADRDIVAEAALSAGFEFVAADETDNWSSMTFRKS